VDAYDNLFVSDTGNSNVYKLDYAHAPTLSFALTKVGTTSSSNPQTVTILNAGNSTLTLTQPGSGSNPSFSAGFAYDSASTCNTISANYTVAAGSSCTIAVDFDPVAAGSPVTGTATLTDNSLNVTGSTQTIALSGNATTLNLQTITFANPGTQTYGTPLTLSATASSGLTVSFASSTATVCTVSGTTVTFLSSGACTITASQAGNTTYAAASSVPRSFTVSTEPQTITFANPGSQTVGTPLTLSATASSGLTVSYASSTTSVCTVSATAVTFLSAGTCTITASQAGNTTYAAASSVPRSFTVSTEPQTITFPALASPVYYGVSPITLSATASSGLAVTFSVVSGPGTLSSTTTLTVTGAGTILIAANQAGDYAYSAAPQVTQSIVVKSTTPTITWATPSAVTYGTSLASALDASAILSGSTIAGTYSYKAAAAGSSSAAVNSTTVLPAGSYSLSVTFTPANTSYQTATGSTTLTVAQASPALSLAASTSTPVLDNPITFTATVTSSAGAPTGSVSFFDGSTALGSGTVSSGVATFTTSSLTIGTHTITAVYAGDNNFTSATSASLSETVQDFNVTLSTTTGSTTSASVAPGQAAVYSLILSPVGATVFPAAVNLSASGLPTGATATFSPSSLAAGTAATTVTLTIHLPQVSAAAPAARPNPFRGPWLPAAPATLALCLLPFARKLRCAGRTLRLGILLIAAAGGLATLSGCGSSSGFFAQPPQTYTITITGTSGACAFHNRQPHRPVTPGIKEENDDLQAP